jgi:hypothetical protein
MFKRIKEFLNDEALFKVPKFGFKASGCTDSRKIQRIFLGFLVLSVAWSGFFEFLFIFKNLKDILELTEDFAAFVTVFFVFAKGCTLYSKQENILNLMKEIERLNEEGKNLEIQKHFFRN